jgi:type III pantothenate kinase
VTTVLLAVDAGNSNITVGVFDGDKLLSVSRIYTDRGRTEDQYAVELLEILKLNGIDTPAFEGAIISCVVTEITKILCRAVRKITGLDPVCVSVENSAGLIIDIESPSQLGTDLIATAVAVREKYPLPCIVMDLGTATKISMVDAKGVFRGCAIAAGIGISLNALSVKTSQLPAISLDAPRCPIGRNTIDAMQSGTVLGTASMLDGLSVRFEKELGEKVESIVATGGYSSDIVPQCERDIILDTSLLLDGLKIIYESCTKK